MLSNSWKYPLILMVLRIVQAEASLTHAEFTNGVLVFRAGRLARLLVGGGIIGFSALIIARASSDEPWVFVGLAAIVVVLCFAWPSTITIRDEGLEQVRWWRSKVRVKWSDVTAIEKNAANDYLVYGRNGQRVVFDRFKIDGFHFAQEVQSRANPKQVIDAAAPLTLGLAGPPPPINPWMGARKKSRRERKEDHAGI